MRNVLIRLPYSSDVSAVIQHAQQTYHAIAFEVHMPHNVKAFIPLTDVMNFYNESFQDQDHVTTFTSQGYTLVPWDELDHEDRCRFAELVELYSEGPDYLSPCIFQNESESEFLQTHQNWLVKAESG